MAYLSLLKTKSTQPVLNLPLKALKLDPSSLFMLTNARLIAKNGVATPYFQTVNDILSYGKDKLFILLSYKPNARYHDVKETITDLEESLARLGLKFNDTEFTIGDVRVSALDVTKTSMKVLQQMGLADKTLDDLVFNGYFKLTRITDDKLVIKNIEEALEKFGLKLEGSQRVLNKANRFPISPYEEFLTQEAVDEYTEIRKRIANKKSKVDPYSYLDKDIKTLRFRRGEIAEFIARKGFKTVKDLVDYGEKNIIEELTRPQLYQIQDILAKRGLMLNGSEVTLDGNKVIRSASKRVNEYIKNDIHIFDFSLLSAEEQKKVLDTKIEDFGFVDFLLVEIKKAENLKTLRDIINTPRKNLVEQIGSNATNKLVKALDKFNIQLVKALYNITGKDFINESTFIYGLNYSNLTEDEKKKFNTKKLEDVGFGSKLIESIQKARPWAKVFGDVLDLTVYEMRGKKLPRNDIGRFISIMERYGINIEEGEKFHRSSKLVYKDKPKFSAEQLLSQYSSSEELKNLSIEALCLSVAHKKILENFQINTIGDICNLSPKDLMVKLDNPYLARKIVEYMSQLNLNMSEMNTFYKKYNVIEPSSVTREELLNSSIEVLGITPILTKKLINAGIDTVENLISNTNKSLSLKGINRPNITQIKQKLSVFGLDLSRLVAKAGEGNYKKKEIIEIVKPVDVMSLSVPEKEEFMKKDIREIGFSNRLSVRLNNLGITSVEDLLSYSYVDYVNMGLPHNTVKSIKDRIVLYNLSLIRRTSGVKPGKSSSNQNNEVKNYKRKMSHLYKYINYMKTRNNSILENEDELF